MEQESSKFKERVTKFIQRNFPQIRMHGGTFQILDFDSDTGEVTIVLEEACNGCGLSPMTIQAIKDRLVKDASIPEITDVSDVTVDVGLTPDPTSSDDNEDQIDAPF